MAWQTPRAPSVRPELQIGLALGGRVLAGDIAGLRTLIAAAQPINAVIFLATSVMTFFPDRDSSRPSAV
jgi:hypothetical protein